MMTRMLAPSIAALCLLAPVPALALAGIPVERLTPAGMHLSDVDVPELADAPLRLRYAPAGMQRAELLVDVLVAEDERHARRAAASFRDRVSGELLEVGGIGDSAAGDGRILAFVRNEVFVVVRRVGGSHDARSVARAIDAVIVTSRVRAPEPIEWVRVPSPQVGATEALELSADVLAAHVVVEGPGTARRTTRGWVLSRTGRGALRVRVIGFDRLLRRLEQIAHVR